MRQANFIVGFNNWGKTYMIYSLMGRNPTRRHSFLTSNTYPVASIGPPVGFMVQSQSNDDVGMKYRADIRRRIHNTRPQAPDLIAALCPALEPRYSMQRIMSDAIWRRFERFNFFLLEYKWDNQALLLLDKVEANIVGLGLNSECYRITGRNFNDKLTQLRVLLQDIYR